MKTAENKFVFITGTSSGIGKALAEEMLERGWEVAGISRRTAEIKSENYQHLVADLSDIKSFVPAITRDLSKKIKDKKFSRIGLVNNAAGAGELFRVEELNPEKLRDLYTLNLVAPVWLNGFFFKNKPGESRLRIVEVSSGAAHTAFPGLLPYCGTKAALKISDKVFAEEQRDNKNLAIFSYEPGTVDTEMQQQLKDQNPEEFPSYNMFKSLRDNNKLVKPEIVVREIAEFLENNSYGYSEKRFNSNT